MDHHVYFWLKKERKNPKDRAAFENALEELCEIPLIESGRWSVPADVPARPVCDLSWDYALDMQFATVAKHNAYQDHPDHVAFVNGHKDWWSKVLVTDLA